MNYVYIENQSLLSQNLINAKIVSYEINRDKKYTEYKIEVSKGNDRWAVKRRYNDFDQFNNKIKKLYPEIKLKLPKKNFFGDNFKEEFLLGRLQGLNEYLQGALNNPNIMKMPTLAEFLEIKNLINVSLNEENEDLELFNNLTNSQNLSENLQRSNSDEINLGSTNNPSASPKDFEYLSVIGKGSFGKVYMARHKSENKIYAIKILQKSAIKKRNEVKHIMAERNVLVRNIAHPFLVALYYSFHTNDKLYFVLDYVNGGELFFHLQRQRIFSENRAKFYAAEISAAIGYLHSKSIIYRDLKPENILIDSQGHVKLTDFGLCKEGIEANTTTSTFCGTPEYLAPEILLKKPYTRAVDWWCLGAVLYEMIYGLPPFYSRDTTEMYNNILTKPLKLNISANVSFDARNIIERLLQKKEELRIGYSNDDFQEIKVHKFFSTIDWVLLLEKKIEAPWKPNLSDSFDLKHIDPEFTQENISSSVYDTSNSFKDTTFNGFSYEIDSNLHKIYRNN